MISRNHRVMLVAAFLVPLLVLILWFASPVSTKCDLYRNLGYVYLAKGTLALPRTQFETAERWFSAPHPSECRPPSAALGLGQSYLGLGQQSSAISALTDGKERDALRHFLLARIYEGMGRPEDARREYRKLPPGAAAYFYLLGDRATQKDDYDQALHYFSISTLIDPASYKAYYGAAFIYWRRLGNEAKAVDMIQRALASDKGSSVEREFYRGLLCYYQDSIDCALEAWVSATRHAAGTETASTHRYLAYEMLSRGVNDYKRFTPEYLAVIEHGYEELKGQDAWRFSMARTAFRIGKYEQAISQFRQGLEQHQDETGMRSELGGASELQGALPSPLLK